MATNANEPVAPVHAFYADASGALCGTLVKSTGLTKREMFAAMAMANMAAGYDPEECGQSVGINAAKWIARASVSLADALLAALSTPEAK